MHSAAGVARAPFALDTERLRIRDLGLNRSREVDFLVRALAHAEFADNLGMETVQRDGAIEIVRAIAADAAGQEGWRGPKFAELRASGEIAGWFTLQRCELDGRDEIELGMAVDPAMWGRGLGFEGTCAMRDFAFSVLGLPTISLTIDARNHASIALARKLGAVYRGEVTYRGAGTLGRPSRIGRYLIARSAG